METILVLLRIFAVLVVGVAAACDLRTRKIPNKITFPAALIGILLQISYFISCGYSGDYWLRGIAGAINAILGWFVAFFIMTSTKLFLRKFGHGDTKLMAAVGAILGPGPVLLAYFYYALVFGVYSLIAMVISVPWGNMWVAHQAGKVGGQVAPVDMTKFETIRKGIIPVAPFIALGTILAIVLQQQTLEFIGLN